jgi:hypothetical protein
MRDPELVARAQRAATRLESAWEEWRALHGLAVAPAQPVVSYVGYSLNEPWGEPRVVIGIDADEAEFLADFLDRDECAGAAQQAPPHQGTLLAEPSQPPDGEYTSTALLGAPVSQVPLAAQVPLGGQVPLAAQAPHGGQVPLGVPAPHGGPGPHGGSAPLGVPAPHGGPGPLGGSAPLGGPAPLGSGPLPLGLRRPVSASADMAAELAGWQSGELPGQAAEQLG